MKKFIIVFIILGTIIGGPFIAKSLYYSGTPLYPFASRILQRGPVRDKVDMGQDPINRAAHALVQTKDDYGYGVLFIDFLKHFWLIAVPDEGVNNKFDYPVGLPYLLFLGPFMYFLIRNLRNKQVPILAIFIVTYWIVWWFGSQQTRFLYIPLVVMYIITIIELEVVPPVLKGALILALCLSALSVFRANKSDFGRSYQDILREKDKNLIARNELYFKDGRKELIELPYGDAAYAQFPINVTQEDLPFIMAQ